MFRKGFALALSIAVPFAALCTPPVHAHVDDHATEHHDEGAVHAHYAPHSSHAQAHDVSLSEDDDDQEAVFLQLFVAVAGQTFVLPAVVPPVLTLTPPADAEFPPQFRVVHGHDPPFLKSLPARAPPSFLS